MRATPKLPSRWKRVRYWFEVRALQAVARLVQWLPRSTVSALGRGLGWIGYYQLAEQRHIALANLEVAFGDTKSRREKSQLARASLQSAAATLACLLWSPRLTRQNLEQWADVEAANLAQVQKIFARGKGIIFLTMHYGDWELLGMATGFYGIPMVVVQENRRNKRLVEFFARLRACSGHQIISQRFAVVRLLKALRRGENIALLIDLNATRKSGGVWVNFFGLPVFNNSAAAGLALRTGAPIVCGIAHPQASGRVRLVYSPEINYASTGDYDADLRALSQKCLEVLEHVIRQQPAYWLWAYKRWDFRPTAEQGRYPDYSRDINFDGRFPDL